MYTVYRVIPYLLFRLGLVLHGLYPPSLILVLNPLLSGLSQFLSVRIPQGFRLIWDCFCDGSMPNPLEVSASIPTMSLSSNIPESSGAGARDGGLAQPVPSRPTVGIPTLSTDTHIFSRPVNTAGSFSSDGIRFRNSFSSYGIIERFNGTLEKMIQGFVNKNTENWDVYIGILMSAYRGTQHPATRCTPNMLMLGREVLLPSQIIFPLPPTQDDQNPDSYISLLKSKLEVYHTARQNLQKSATRQNKNNDTRVSQLTYKIGSLMYKYNDCS